MTLETYYLMWMVVSTTLTIVMYFVSKRQLREAISDSHINGYVEWFSAWLNVWEELEQWERKLKHRQESKKSYQKRKD